MAEPSRLQNTSRDLLFRLVIEGRLAQLQSLINNKRFSQEEREELINSVDDKECLLNYLASIGNEAVLRNFARKKKPVLRTAGFNKVPSESLHAKNRTAYDEGWYEDELFVGTLLEFTALHMAAYFGHEEIIRWLLSDSGGRAAGFNSVLTKEKNGNTALHIAAREGRVSCLQALLEGCKVENGEREELSNAVDKYQSTVLHAAAYEGQESVIRWLLSDSGGRAFGFKSLLSKDQRGFTALLVAAERGHLPCLISLVEGSKVENGEREELLSSSSEALRLAASNGRESVLRWLLSESGGRAAGFVFSSKHLFNTLHVSVESGLTCVQAVLEECKAEERVELINAVDACGSVILHSAAFGNQKEIIRWLLSDSGGRALGFHNIIAKNKKSNTALHVAVQKDSFEAFKALLEGCKLEERVELINAVNDAGQTVLHVAVIQQRESIIRWLLSDSGGRAAGFNSVIARDVHGKNALFLAIQDNRLSCLRVIVNGCKVENGEREEMLNAVDSRGYTVLHWTTGHVSILQWLLSDSGGRAAGLKSSTITATTTTSGLSALHYAAQNLSVDSLRALLSGCTTGERLTLFLSIDKHGWSVLHCAVRFGKPDIIRELLLHHPETKTVVDHRDHRGMTALHRAVLNGGLDEEDFKEWRYYGQQLEEDKQIQVVEALLTFTPIDNDAKEDPQAARLDVNLGLKIE